MSLIGPRDFESDVQLERMPVGCAGTAAVTSLVRRRGFTLNQSFSDTGAIQWDGKHLAVGNQATANIYHFSINGSKGTEVGVTVLGGDAHWVHKFVILDHKVIAPNFYFINSKFESNVLIFDYPKGGSPLKTISKGVKASETAVVSLAKK